MQVEKNNPLNSVASYQAPVLTVLGSVSMLTASGTGTVAETVAGPNNCSGQTDQRPCG